MLRIFPFPFCHMQALAIPQLAGGILDRPAQLVTLIELQSGGFDHATGSVPCSAIAPPKRRIVNTNTPFVAARLRTGRHSLPMRRERRKGLRTTLPSETYFDRRSA